MSTHPVRRICSSRSCTLSCSRSQVLVVKRGGASTGAKPHKPFAGLRSACAGSHLNMSPVRLSLQMFLRHRPRRKRDAPCEHRQQQEKKTLSPPTHIPLVRSGVTLCRVQAGCGSVTLQLACSVPGHRDVYDTRAHPIRFPVHILRAPPCPSVSGRRAGRFL